MRKIKLNDIGIPWKTTIIILLAGIFSSAFIIMMRTNTRVDVEKKTYRVEFFNDKGEQHCVKQVEEGGYVIAPELSLAEKGIAFGGWEQYTNNITQDMKVKPIFTDLTSENNIFYTDSCYLERKGTAWIDIWVGKNFSINDVKLYLRYDPQVLEVLDYKSDFSITKDETERIQVNVSVSENIIVPTSIARIKVKAKDIDCLYTKISIEPEEAKEGIGRDAVDAEWAVLNGRIYIY